jgi:hypothetical protein
MGCTALVDKSIIESVYGLVEKLYYGQNVEIFLYLKKESVWT